MCFSFGRAPLDVQELQCTFACSKLCTTTKKNPYMRHRLLPDTFGFALHFFVAVCWAHGWPRGVCVGVVFSCGFTFAGCVTYARRKARLCLQQPFALGTLVCSLRGSGVIVVCGWWAVGRRAREQVLTAVFLCACACRGCVLMWNARSLANRIERCISTVELIVVSYPR